MSLGRPEPRSYQIEACDAIFREFDKGVRKTLLVMSTGTGKTMVATMVAERMAEQGNTTLFVAHREILVRQAAATFEGMGLDVAVEMGAERAYEFIKTGLRPDVIVASVQSLHPDRIKNWPKEFFNLIICDESHHILSPMFLEVLDYFKDYNLLGVTATPARGDKKNLGSLFESKAYEYRLQDAVRDRALVPIKLRRCHVSVDLRGIRTVGGDFSRGDLEERIGPKIEILARAFAREIGERKAVAFLPDIGSSQAFATVLDKLGYTAKYVAGSGGDYGMSKKDSLEIRESFKRNDFQVITCCELLTEGWDEPPVSAVGVLKPTKMWHRLVQMAGRATRRHEKSGKTDAILIDFDWQADQATRNLCASVNIFNDGSLDNRIIELATKIVEQKQKKDEEVDALEVIEEAKQQFKREKKFRIPLNGKKEKYKVYDYDPIGTTEILGMPKLSYHDKSFSQAPKITEKQAQLLKDMGVRNPEQLSLWGASKLIDKLVSRKRDHLCSANQMRLLNRHGYSIAELQNMSFENASKAIDKIMRRSQKELFND